MTVRTSLMSPFPLEMSLAISLTSTSPSSSEMLDSVLYSLCIPVYHSLFVIVNRPPLGDATTPYSQVEAFYNFWYMFRSTRTFNSKDEYNPEVQEKEVVEFVGSDVTCGEEMDDFYEQFQPQEVEG